MKRQKVSLVSGLLLWMTLLIGFVPELSHAHERQAKAKIYALEIALTPTQYYSDEQGHLRQLIFTRSGSSGTPIGFPNHVNGELRPHSTDFSSGTQTFSTDYIQIVYIGWTPYIVSYGSMELLLPVADKHGPNGAPDGVPDIFQPEYSTDIKVTGSFKERYDVSGTNDTGSIEFSFRRNANNSAGLYELSSGRKVYGTFYIERVEPTFKYVPFTGAFKLNLSGDGYTASGATTFTRVNRDAIRVNGMKITDSSGWQSRLKSFTLKRVGKTYRGIAEWEDGYLTTSYRDYLYEYVVLTDNNDRDRDGIPDLSDDPIFPPKITNQPPGRIVAPGNTTTFKAGISGTAPFTYQWRLNGTRIPGATNAQFTIKNVQLSHAGNYTVVIKNLESSVTSAPATLRVCNVSVAQSHVLLPFSGGETNITVSTVGDCSWTVTSTNSWIHFSPTHVGGNTTITISVLPHNGDSARFGYINIGKATVAVIQTGVFAPTQLNARRITLSAADGSGNLANSGTFTLITSSSGGKFLTAEGAGTFSYTRGSSTAATLSFTHVPADSDSSPAAGNIEFAFNSPGSGTYVLNLVSGEEGTQTGTFVVSPAKPDLNGDMRTDALWQHTSGALRAWLLNGTTVLGKKNLGAPATGWRLVAQTDLNGDAHSDFVLQHDDGRLGAWLANGNSYHSIPLRKPNAGWRLAGIADFNNDGRNDFVFQNDNGTASVWFMNGTNYLSSSSLHKGQALPSGWRITGVADFNNDLQTDLLLQHTDGRLVIWLMNQRQQVCSIPLPKPSSGWRVAGVADLTNDGWTDILFQRADGQSYVWVMNGTTFVSRPSLSNGQLPDSKWRLVGPR